MPNSKKNQSPLVEAVLALDDYFSELDRVGTKINSLEMKSEFDFEHAERLMTRFAECGQGVASEIMKLSTHLNEARARAESLAQGVSSRAELITARKSEQQTQLDQFQVLAQKVGQLNAVMKNLKRPEGEKLTDGDRAELSKALAALNGQLDPLIEQAAVLRKNAQLSKMKNLEQNAESLTQTLQSVRQKITSLDLH